jgi:hypothetical protein
MPRIGNGMSGKGKLELDYANPPRPIGTIEGLGELQIRGVSIGTIRAFNELESGGALPASRVVDHLLTSVVERTDGTKLTTEDLASLGPEEKALLVSALVERQADWFGDAAAGQEPDAAGEPETGEEKLARAFRAHNADFLASSHRVSKAISGATKGMSQGLKALLTPKLTANTEASERLRALLEGINRRPSIIDSTNALSRAPPSIAHARISGDPPRIPEIDIPPHPAYETNALLEQLSVRIGDMHALAVATSELQRTLNETASDAVAQFAKGAEDSQQAAAVGLEISRNSLGFAKAGFWVALASAALSLVAIVVSIYFAKAQDRDERRREAEASRRELRLIAAENRLAAVLEDNARAARQRTNVAPAENRSTVTVGQSGVSAHRYREGGQRAKVTGKRN